MAEVIAWLCLAILYHVYDGYKRVLLIAASLTRGRGREDAAAAAHSLPFITVLLTVHNEEAEIGERLSNILDSDYPADKLEVLVASDGSTDQTEPIVAHYGDVRVRLYRPEERLGKTETQNRAILLCRGEIVLFTDAGTRFDKGFLSAIAAPFSNENVGAVDGHLLFVHDIASGISRSQGYYWDYELVIRQLESDLDMLAVASGACLAVRKGLFVRMDSNIGEDCIVPLDIVAQGYKVIHASNALAFDRMDRSPDKEFRTRVRMTLRNWQGTWARPDLLNPFVSPYIAFALWSHKIFRWLSPFLLIGLTVSAVIGAANGSVPMCGIVAGLSLLYGAAMVGWLFERDGKRAPVAHLAYGFMLANAGFLVGVLKALAGRKIYTYR